MPPARRRSGLASHGLDAVIPAAHPGPGPDSEQDTTRGSRNRDAGRKGGQEAGPDGRRPAQPKKPTVVRFQSYVTPDLAEAVRDAVAYLGGRWTTGTVMQRALEAEVQRLAQQYHDGQPFPSREDEQLRRGPRL